MLKLFKTSSKKEFFSVSSILVLSIFLLVVGTNVIFIMKSSPGRLLKDALKNIENKQNNLEILIKERGADYLLTFQGNLYGGRILHGKFIDYDLEVYKVGKGKIYVRDLKDNLWKEAAELSLGNLEDFFHSPFVLLQDCSSYFQKGKYVKGHVKNGKVIVLRIPADHLALLNIFQDYMQYELYSLVLECFIFVQEDSLFINQIQLFLHDERSKKNILRRFFFFNNADSSI